MSLREIMTRLSIARAALRGEMIVWRANFRWEENTTLRIRTIDPTSHGRVSDCLFDTNPEAENDLRIEFGEARFAVR